MMTFLSKLSTRPRGSPPPKAKWTTNTPFAEIRITTEPPKSGWWRWSINFSFEAPEAKPAQGQRESRHALRCSNVFDPVPDLVRFIEAIAGGQDAEWLVDEEGRVCDMHVWSISSDFVLFHIDTHQALDYVKLHRQTLLRELAKAYLDLIEDDGLADWCRDLPSDDDHCAARAFYAIPYHSAGMQRLLASLFPARHIDPVPLLGFIRPGGPPRLPTTITEGHGKVLQALFGERLPAVMGQARRALLSGDAPVVCEDTESETRITVRVWPECATSKIDKDFEVAGIALAGVFTPDERGFALPAIFPLLEGTPNLNDLWDNTLFVTDRFPWSNAFEGEVQVEGPFQVPLRLYECLHFRETFCEWACSCDVAAVAYSCAKARDVDMYVKGLHDYKVEKEAYFAAHPAGRPLFPGILVRTNGSRRLEATETSCEYRYRTTADRVEKLYFCGVPIYRMHVLLAGWPGEHGIYAYLYASEKILQGCTPDVGDAVEGVCRLYCRFTHRRPAGTKEGYIHPPFPERAMRTRGPKL